MSSGPPQDPVSSGLSQKPMLTLEQGTSRDFSEPERTPRGSYKRPVISTMTTKEIADLAGPADIPPFQSGLLCLSSSKQIQPVRARMQTEGGYHQL